MDSSSSLLGEPHTTPENESSVITGVKRNSGVYLFTADAGCSALSKVAASYEVESLAWMQIPHHGSRRNLTANLIEHFAPKAAFVSASGSQKHPRRAVVNAFKKFGSVYSTHYPDAGHLWHHQDNVRTQTDYSSATPLYEEKGVKKAAEPDLWALVAAIGNRR